MKRTYILIFGLGLLLNLAACRPKEPVEPAKQCRLTSVTERNTGSASSSTNTIEYRYDASGNLVQLVSKYLETYVNGSPATSRSSDAVLTYDGDGYLKKASYQFTDRSSGNESTSTQDWEYSYSNGRLSKTVRQYRYTGSNGTQTTLYEYDDAGKPLKVTME